MAKNIPNLEDQKLAEKKEVKIRWNGAAPTLIRKIPNGEKYPIKKGETMVIAEEVAKSVSSAYKECEIIDDAKEIPAKKKMKIEGKLNAQKIAKG